VGQLRKNQRVKQFDESSLDLLTKLKTDYHHSKIMLDKQRYFIEAIKKTLEEGK
jgi:hypothetical protein